jgi:phosphatidylserine/phosphatidylglycerophosphate/cardiolipin synthase-like enzyme
MSLSDGKDWFIPENLKAGASPVFNYCFVEAFVDAEEYYAALRKDIEAVTNSSSSSDCWLFWIGFEASGDTWIPASAPAIGTPKKYSPRPKQPTDIEFLDLLRQADSKGVKLRALLTLHPKPDTKNAKDRYKTHNFTLCQTINTQFKNAFAINDFRYLYMNGVHHQKLFMIYDGRALIAYSGGLDIERARIEMCWCDFHCRFVGEPADHFFSLFKQRWVEHFSQKTPKLGFNAANEALPPAAGRLAASGKAMCQIGTTYGNPQRSNPFFAFPTNQPAEQNLNLPHRLEISAPYYPGPATAFLGLYLSISVSRISNKFFLTQDPDGVDIVLHARIQPRLYGFALTGHHAIYDLLKNAIAQTKEFIYIEDQYLVCDQSMGNSQKGPFLVSVLDLLKAKVAKNDFKKLVILATRIDEINDDFQNTGWAHRSSFIRDLHGAAGGQDKVAICQYKSNKQIGRGNDDTHSPFYVHSKTWIFDDKLLLSGSANCNRRGYSHDSELDFAIYDTEETWVRDTRARIWMRRLNTEGCFNPPTMAELKDTNNANAWTRWFKPYKYTKDLESSAYYEDKNGERRGQLNDFAPVTSPDKGQPQLEQDINASLGQYGAQVKITSLFSQYLWDNVVDPDGV